MALIEQKDTIEVTAGEGSSATRQFACDWDERLAVSGLPAFGDVYPGGSSYLIARRIERNRSGDKCLVTVEYSTPRSGAGQGDGPLDPPFDDPPIVSESIQVDRETFNAVRGFQVTLSEEYLQDEVTFTIPHLILRTTRLYSEDYSPHLLQYLDSVNANDITESLGDLVTFKGDVGELWFSDMSVEVDIRQIADGTFVPLFRTMMEFRKRSIDWNRLWINPVPARTSNGQVLVYNDAHPFVADGTHHKFGDVVLKPWTLSGTDYILNTALIGWQAVSNVTPDPNTGATYQNQGLRAQKVWTDLIPIDGKAQNP